MTKAKIGDIEVTIYRYYQVNGYMICDVKYPHINRLLPVIAELIELEV